MRILNKVERLLYNYPILRDSDKKLLVAVWSTQGLELTSEQKQAFYDKCTTPETITRARRFLKEKYPASEQVAEERYNKFKAYRDAKAVSWINE